MHTRRSFLKSTAWGGALGSTVPAFLAATFDQLQAEHLDRAVAPVTGRDGPVLVVIQLAGGNDGLNTLVPFRNDHYHRARPKLGLKAETVRKIRDDVGLHPALGGFQELHDQGQLGIVQSVGYPNPNRSHFRSTDIWMTATDSNRFSNLGWIGRYFDNACSGSPPTVGLAVGRQSPLAFSARQPRGIALENPESFRFADADEASDRESTTSGTFYRRMNAALEDAPLGDPENAGGSISMLEGSGSPVHQGSALDFLERTSLDAQISSDRIQAIANRVRNEAIYPASKLATDLRLVARLIAGGLGTRVYYVSQGGYDTHTHQAGAHHRLLGNLGDAMAAFIRDLKALGQSDRVLVMTFSEFGRRVAENGNAGTDHGAAAPLFLAGTRVRAGVHGKAPELDPKLLHNGDIRHTTDFRTVYASLLAQWLRTDPKAILGSTFPTLPLIA
ncbi:MAG: DUF1501 domain-containing protein [Verrucomicrobiota bacterium]